MQGVTLEQLEGWSGGFWQGLGGDRGVVDVAEVSTDTRTISLGALFVALGRGDSAESALSGATHDGHDFVDEAFARGAVAAVVERRWGEQREDGPWRQRPLLLVEDTLQAFGDLAKGYREQFDIPIVAIVGSAGKTTTKEMTAAVLGSCYNVLKTEGNENNEIGVPKVLFRLTARHEVAVVEMAARRVGDIRYLCEIARPTIGLFLNVGTAHLEYFETVERVAKAKGELLDYVGGESSVALVNADDCVVAKEAMRTKGRLLGFGLGRGSHISGEGLALDQEGCGRFSLQHHPVHLKIPGKHNVYNALAAAAAGFSCAVSAAQICSALSDFRAVGMRSEILRKNGICVINDCYNANPGSVRAALDVLTSIEAEGRRIAVLGDMLELGEQGPRLHAEIGQIAARQEIDRLAVLGPLGVHTVAGAIAAGLDAESVLHFEDKASLGDFMESMAEPGDLILVKGSRGIELEEIVDRVLLS